MLEGWGFILVQMKGQHKENFDKSWKIFSWIRTTGQNALIFSMEHPWGKVIQVCSNKVSGVIHDHAINQDTFLYRFI